MSRRPLSLRRRVALAYTVLGFVLSLLFAVATIFIADDYEQIVIDEILRGQAEDYGLRFAADPATVLPRTHRLSGYLHRADGGSDVPPQYAALAPGIHESPQEDTDGIHIGVFDTDQGRFFFVMDLRDIERVEGYLEGFVAVALVLGTGIAGWLGWALAGHTVIPVKRLAQAVDALPTRPQASGLAETVSNDELGKLALAIDRYQARLVEADASERRLYADASHELRTPIAVVRASAEVLLDDPTASDYARRRLQRLDRGMRELTDLLDALLDLARRREPVMETLSVASLLGDAASSLVATGERGLGQRVEIDAQGRLYTSQRESLLILRGVIRRVLPPEIPGTLFLRYADSVFHILFTTDTGDDDEPRRPAPAAERSDRGLGLALIGRLAERLGWEIDDRRAEDPPRQVSIRVPG
jgi:hypothetical protein